ncbi:MAG TPA: DUF711 family protein [Chloroflexota bacterium]|nr:DUF711 family protein [Chloroflexota bacterium]
MKIRSVTLGNNVTWPLSRGEFAKAQRFFNRARALFEEAGVEVQTVRLATQPLESMRAPALELAAGVEAACGEAGIGYCSLGPAPLDAGLIAELIGSTSIVFASVATAHSGEVDFPAGRTAAAVVRRVADSTELGFGNLRFAAAAHCGPNIPFFPVAYHDGGHPKFALALQCADLAVEAFSGEGSMAECQARLAEALATADRALSAVAKRLEREFAIEYLGADFSFAPFPREAESIGAAFQRLGLERFGASGSIFVASLLTRTVKSAQLGRWGLNGLMLPVLEDAALAAGTDRGDFSVNDLLLYSAVCGTGLDTVPLPGDVSEDELAGIILDVSALSVTLDRKPLTARLLPVPGKKAGDRTTYDFEYFANGTVLPVKGLSPKRLLDRETPPLH